MSHITKIHTTTRITSLDKLAVACRLLGTVEFVRDAKQHKYWGGNLAPCNHKIRVIGNQQAYEIGVVQEGDHFALNADFFLGGYGLEDAVGKDAQRLTQAYNVVQACEAFQLNGFAFTEQTTLESGAVKCVFEI